MQALKRSLTLNVSRATTLVAAQTPRFSTLNHLVAAKTQGFSTFREKERGEEIVYFSKQDARLLKALVEKMEAHHEAIEEVETEIEAQFEVEEEPRDAMSEDLQSLFDSHNLGRGGKDGLLFKELLEWRHRKY